MHGAAKAGLQPGDVIVKVKGRRTRAHEDIGAHLTSDAIGSMAAVQYVRGGTLGSTRVRLSTDDGALEGRRAILGVATKPIPSVPYLETVVTAVAAGGRAAAAGLHKGDVVVGVGKRGSLQAAPLSRALQSVPYAPVEVRVVRKGKPVVVGVPASDFAAANSDGELAAPR